MYAKVPNFAIDLVKLPFFKGKIAEEFAAQVVQTRLKATQHLQAANEPYKIATDAHCYQKTFNEGDLVMVHLWKEKVCRRFLR